MKRLCLLFVMAGGFCVGMEDEFLREYRILETNLRRKPVMEKGADAEEVREAQAYDRRALFWATDKDPLDVVLRRGDALAADLGVVSDEWAAIKREAENATADRKALYLRACAEKRKIAFANPLLRGMDALLFVTREAQGEDERHDGNHMVDQYFGFHATRGGKVKGNGLFVLNNPFSDAPETVNLLRRAVENGRMKGMFLSDSGGFLAPDISFDGKEILFCYTEGVNDNFKWTEQSTWKIFRVRADGSGLRMLTDGAVSDLFPCWLPSGRVMFVSERRGGFGRCHPYEKPSFTLHSMHGDGTDITCLSPHETNEWMPSVDHAGMVVYTRWDYVDRGALQAHHPWIVYPDGRDARAIAGNTHASMQNVPNMIMDVRAIPGSPCYSGLSSAHHSEARGSIVLIDPRIPDDDNMAQIKRVTPDQLFTEAEVRLGQRTAIYASPYPLSEKYYLCVYDGAATDQYGNRVEMAKRNYAIALVDAFGNKEILYRDPRISCLSPMPLRARKRPPVIPHGNLVGLPPNPDGSHPAAVPKDALPKLAKVGVTDVYNSRRAFPEGAKITHLRIWQVLPKMTPVSDRPRMAIATWQGAKACLGTVPVEEDGSAYFEAPVNAPILFQALTADGTALQGMRSITYAFPGETLLCNGCHEQRVGAPPKNAQPAAMKRAPSAITPEVDGANPFSYPRLVQPVLDAKCVACHTVARADGKKAPDLTQGDWRKDPDLFYASYRSLMPHVHNYGGGIWLHGKSYTLPLTFGANASKLHKMLKGGHNDVKLTPDEMHRLVLWMDSNVLYFGHDADMPKQAAGELVGIRHY
ncbi:MAG: hypothetical protein FWG50_06695 [Kiritimatiellaeota bacterium]|nr:hypothetical protein [Kiritimatiellota bacterium]